jgi:hypothetical protein
MRYSISRMSALTVLFLIQLSTVGVSENHTNNIPMKWMGSYSQAPSCAKGGYSYHNTKNNKSYVMINNHWEVLAEVSVGPQGPIGPAGPQGLQGLKGDKGDPGSFPSGNAPGDMQYWDGTRWVMVPGGKNGQTLTYCNGKPIWGQCNQGDLVLWNKLGSDAEIANSEIGPGGLKTDGYFVPGPFPSFGQAFENNRPSTSNFVLSFPVDMVVSKQKGTVEFWAKLNNFPDEVFDAVTLLHYVSTPPVIFPVFSWRMGFGSSNGCSGVGLYGTVGMATNSNCAGLVDVATQQSSMDNILGDRAAWHHYAMIWNEEGIPELSGKKVYLYLDGNLLTTPHYHDGSPWGAIPSGSRLALTYFYNITGASIAVDNLKIWKVTKTNFADRFTE